MASQTSHPRTIFPTSFLVLIFMTIKTCLGLEYGFQLLDHNVTYWQALQACRNRGFSGLAILDSQEKRDYVFDLLDSQRHLHGDVWIGMQLSPMLQEFAWNNGVLMMSNITWYLGEPDRIETQHCIRVKTKINNQGFATGSCGFLFTGLCGDYDDQITVVTLWDNVAPKETSTDIEWQGTTRNFVECNVLSDQNVDSKFVSYDAQNRKCTFLSSNFDIITDTVPQNGSFIGISSNTIKADFRFD